MMDARIQMKMQFSMINACYTDCVSSFSSGDISAKEKACLTNCGSRGVQLMHLFSKVNQESQGQQGGMGGF